MYKGCAQYWSSSDAVCNSRSAKAMCKLVCVIGCHCIITREYIRSHLLYRSPTAIGNVSVTYVTSVPLAGTRYNKSCVYSVALGLILLRSVFFPRVIQSALLNLYAPEGAGSGGSLDESQPFRREW